MTKPSDPMTPKKCQAKNLCQLSEQCKALAFSQLLASAWLSWIGSSGVTAGRCGPKVVLTRVQPSFLPWYKLDSSTLTWNGRPYGYENKIC